MIEECKKQIIKAHDSSFWEQNFHATRIKRFVERHADGDEILEKNLLYLVVITKLQKPNIESVSMDLLTYNKEGKVKCLFCDSNDIIGYIYEPLPNNTIGRKTGFLFLLCSDHETKIQKMNPLVTQAVDQLYSQNNY